MQGLASCDISDDHVLSVFHVWMPGYCKRNSERYLIGNNVELFDAPALALQYEGLASIDRGCRGMITSEFEFMQLVILDGTIHIKLDETAMKNKKESYITFSRMIMSKKFDKNGKLVAVERCDQQQTLRTQFAHHCTTSYLGTEEEQAAGVILAIWKSPFEKDHANGEPSEQTRRNVRNCHSDDNKRAHKLKTSKK